MNSVFTLYRKNYSSLFIVLDWKYVMLKIKEKKLGCIYFKIKTENNKFSNELSYGL